MKSITSLRRLAALSSPPLLAALLAIPLLLSSLALHAASLNSGVTTAFSGNIALTAGTGDTGARLYRTNTFTATGTVDPVQTLEPSGFQPTTLSLGTFGRYGLAIDGTAALVGFYEDKRFNTGASNNVGAVYVYKTLNTGTTSPKNQQALLSTTEVSAADNAADNTRGLGINIAVDGTIAVVGAYQSRLSSLSNVGAAYVYRGWATATGTKNQDVKLTPSDPVASMSFGRHVAISGTTAIVGRTGGNHAYVFRSLDTATGTVTQNKKLVPSVEASSGRAMVAIDGATAIVAHGADNVAYVFRSVNSGSGNQAENLKLLGSDAPTNNFGRSVAISATTVVASPAVFVGSDNAAYVFEGVNSGSGTKNEILKISRGNSNSFWGNQIDFKEDNFIIGGSYTGSLSSMTTLNTGSVTKNVENSFVSKVDWVIGQSTSSNKVIVTGVTGTVTETGKAVYIGRNAGANTNTLELETAARIAATNVYVGASATANTGTGNTLLIGGTTALTSARIGNIYLGASNNLIFGRTWTTPTNLFTFLGTSGTKLFVRSGSSWVEVTSANYANYVKISTTSTGGAGSMLVTPGTMTLTISPTATQNVAAPAGSLSIAVTADIPWTAASSATTWLGVTPASGSTNGTLTVTYAMNTTGASRSGTITVSGGGITRTITVTQAAATVTVTPTAPSATAPAGSLDLTITSNTNTAWTASSSNTTWLTVAAASGTANGTLKINFTANTTGASRNATITVTSAGVSRSVTVTQAAAVLTLAPASQSPTALAGSFAVTVTSDFAWTASSSATGWLTVSPLSGGPGGAFTVAYSDNTSGASRSGTISVVSGGVTKTVNVTQAAAVLTVSKTTQSMTAAAGNFTFDITSSFMWSLASSDISWLTFSPAGSTTPGGTVTVYCTENTGAQRIGTITVTSGGVSKTVTVTQAAATLTLSKSSENVPAASGSFTVDVTSDIGWTASSDATTWLTVSPTGSSTAGGTLTVYYTANTGTARSGTITVTSGTATRTIVVNQAAPKLDVSPTSKDVTYAADSFDITVDANVSWIASSSATSWLTITPDNGTGSGKVTVTYTANTGAARSGTITFIGGGLMGSVVVNQAAGPYLNVDTATKTMADTSGNFTAEVTSNVVWTAVSDSSSWLNVSPANGSDDGTLTIVCLPNTGAAERQGTITVSSAADGVSKTIVVTQSVFAPDLTVDETPIDTPETAGSQNIAVSANVFWTASSDSAWLTVTPPAGSPGNSSFTISWTANLGAERYGLVTVEGGGFTRVILVTQDASATGSAEPATITSVTVNTANTLVTIKGTSDNAGGFYVIYSAEKLNAKEDEWDWEDYTADYTGELEADGSFTAVIATDGTARFYRVLTSGTEFEDGISSSAEAFSENVGGYYIVSLPLGVSQWVANQFDQPDQKISTLFNQLGTNSSVIVETALGSFTTATKMNVVGWGANGNIVIPRGKDVQVTARTAAANLAFAGTLSNDSPVTKGVPTAAAFTCSALPIAGAPDDFGVLPRANNAQASQISAAGAVSTKTVLVGNWSGGNPLIKIGEAYRLRYSTTVPKTWTQELVIPEDQFELSIINN